MRWSPTLFLPAKNMAKQGQIWVETVIYTLIILAIIGVLLAILTPAINEKKDQVVVEKSIEMMNTIDSAIEGVRFHGAGNSLPVELQIKKGQLEVNSEQDYIEFSITSKFMYSELGQTVVRGKINTTTTAKGKDYLVVLHLDYSSLDISWNKKQETKIISSSPNVQKIWIANYGRVNSKVNIDLNS